MQLLARRLFALSENLFLTVESELLELADKESFSKSKIETFLKSRFIEKINSGKTPSEKGFIFERLVCDFFEYKSFKVLRTKKTCDFGIDGIIEVKLSPFGTLRLGLQVKYKKISAKDFDVFVQSLNFAEIKIGVLVCKDSAKIQRNSLNSKVKAILSTKGGNLPKLPDFELNQAFILKAKDIIELAAEQAFFTVKSIYKGGIE